MPSGPEHPVGPQTAGGPSPAGGARREEPSGEGLAGRAVLVSGSAAGIGRAVSHAFSSRGARLCLADVDGPGLSELVTGLRRRTDEVVTAVGDVTTPIGAAAAVEAAADAFGRIDVLVNVVGGSRPGHDVVELDQEGWEAMLRFNLTSTYLMCHHAVPHLRAAGGGAIVNVSSGAGLRGMRKNPGYCAAKAGVVGLTKALAIDHGDDGIRVNAVAPGPVLTPLMQRNRTEAQIGELAGLTLVGRVALPEEVAEAVVFLAGDRSSFMTGQVLEVDGGVRGGV